MLGDELKKARLKAKMTQEELSFASGLDRTYISQLENDRKSPTVDVLFRLCEALGASASKLLWPVSKISGERWIDRTSPVLLLPTNYPSQPKHYFGYGKPKMCYFMAPPSMRQREDAMPKSKKQIDHDPIVARFGQRLREVRANRGMTQAQLAETAQVTISYITRLESGTSAPGIDLVARFATALGTEIANLLPTNPLPDDLAVLRKQAKKLFDALLQTEDRETLSLLNQFLARLAETGR